MPKTFRLMWTDTVASAMTGYKWMFRNSITQGDEAVRGLSQRCNTQTQAASRCQSAVDRGECVEHAEYGIRGGLAGIIPWDGRLPSLQ
jgi:hypothetical protein